MNGGLATSPLPSSAVCRPRIPPKPQQLCGSVLPWGSSSNLSASQGSLDHFLGSSELKFTRIGSVKFSRSRCNSSNYSGPPGSGENENKIVLDAFFLGKALAEAVNERIESTVGEFLSAIGRLQAEQQKQVQDFQEEVLERAKKSKEKAARQAMEAQGLIPKSTAANISTVSNGVVSEITSSAPNYATPANSSSSRVQPSNSDPEAADKDPFLGLSNED